MFLVQTRGYSRTLHSNGVLCFSTLKSAVEYIICVYVGVYKNDKARSAFTLGSWQPPDPYEKFEYWYKCNFKVTEVFVDSIFTASKPISKKKIRETVKEHGMKV